jgi:hypothetical protein
MFTIYQIWLNTPYRPVWRKPYIIHQTFRAIVKPHTVT